MQLDSLTVYNGKMFGGNVEPNRFFSINMDTGLHTLINGSTTYHLGGMATIVPESTTMLLLSSGLIGIAGFRREFQKG